MATTKGWDRWVVITTEQTVVSLQGLQQLEDRILVDDWQRAWDEMTDEHLEGNSVEAVRHLKR